MNQKLIGNVIAIAILLAGVTVLSGCNGSNENSGSAVVHSEEKHEAHHHDDHEHKAHDHEDHQHEAHHDGCLNAVETCAVGHAEVKLEGNVLKVWFVGGESETDKAVRVSDQQIVLMVTPEGGEETTLTLNAKPNELAEETVGDCSYFEGNADWLAGVTEFEAIGKVHLKGKERPLKIVYPEGFDPDSGHEHDHTHAHDHSEAHAHDHDDAHDHNHDEAHDHDHDHSEEVH